MIAVGDIAFVAFSTWDTTMLIDVTCVMEIFGKDRNSYKVLGRHHGTGETNEYLVADSYVFSTLAALQEAFFGIPTYSYLNTKEKYSNPHYG